MHVADQKINTALPCPYLVSDTWQRQIFKEWYCGSSIHAVGRLQRDHKFGCLGRNRPKQKGTIENYLQRDRVHDLSTCAVLLIIEANFLFSLEQPSGEKQEILISLSYLPSAERLTVVLLKARNLHPPPNKDTIGMYDEIRRVCLYFALLNQLHTGVSPSSWVDV